MPGMGGPLSANNLVIVGAFHAALRQQAVYVLLLVALAVLARGWMLTVSGGHAVALGTGGAEHPARRVLRIGFGALWILDGLLQTQQAMPVGLPGQVVTPTVDGAPAWVRHLVATGTSIWSRHPITAAASVVWIQIGVGVLLLIAPRLRPSQLAGLVSVAWALLVWVFGEGFGGVLTPGGSWLFGFPGAALLYGVAGALIALPEEAWDGRRAGRWLLRGLGGFFVAMAVFQAWPGRGFWSGGTSGQVTSMVTSMSQTPQPDWLASLLRSFASFAAGSGWLVNLVAVVALASIGAGLLFGKGRILTVAVVAGGVLCLLAWVLIQDLGVLGGLGTDPNSMVPTVLLLAAGYLGATRDTAAPVPAQAEAEVPPVRHRWAGAAAAGLVATAAALGVTLVGALPMAAASVRSGTSTIVTEALNGEPQSSDTPAPAFRLVDQDGRAVSLSDLRGRTVALTFLDPVCTSDCPLIAQQFRLADEALGSGGKATTAFVAVVANPIYRSQSVVQAFDRQEDLGGIANWYFLTGTVAELQRTWSAYGIEVQPVAAGGMVAHSDNAFVIDKSGHLRWSFGADPGDGSVEGSSFGALVGQEMRSVMRT